MYTFEHCQDIINKELEEISLKDSPVNLYEPIRYILSIGGKRLRPSLTLMGCNIFSDKIENAIYPALAVEIFHNFTLMHDDLMDKSDIRRNYPTVHKKWEENIAVLLKVPERKEIANLYSKGVALVNEVHEWHEMFGLVFKKILKEVQK